ncbi:MAG: DUF1465 family protein [Hyphomicrobiaceae bacterium]
MKNESRVDEGGSGPSGTISFGDRFQSSEQFNQIFKEGMALVERTANYLDGAGRRDAKDLSPATTVLYATESMRLTTRLLDIASWLLIRRALKQGEISQNEARIKRQSVKLQTLGRPAHTKGFDDLPLQLRSLIGESFEMLDRVLQLDRAMNFSQTIEPAAAQTANPVGAQIVQLHQAFTKK